MAAQSNRRKVRSIVLGTSALLLLIVFVVLNAFNEPYFDPETTEYIFLYTGLSVVVFLLFVAALILLIRNIFKLYAEQRSRVMGTRLRTRLLWGAVLVSLVPLMFMFGFSYLLLNRAVERWQSQPVTEMGGASNRISAELSRYATANAQAEAGSIAAGLPDVAREDITESGLQKQLQNVLQLHEMSLQDGFAMIYRGHRAMAAIQMPRLEGAKMQLRAWPTGASGTSRESSPEKLLASGVYPDDELIFAAAQRSDTPLLRIGENDYTLGAATTQDGATVVVGLPVPQGVTEAMTSLNHAATAYWTLVRSRRPLRTLYLLLLMMMTGLAMFVSSWLVLHLSRQVTKPVEALADAMAAISSGDYAQRVKEGATEELGELVRSFNHMAADLEGSRRAVEESTVQLSAANRALETRRSELETMLQTIPSGVAMLNSERRITMANRALTEMIARGAEPFTGVSMENAFPSEIAEVLDKLIGRSRRMGSASSEVEMPSASIGGTLHLLATVALLESAVNDRGRREPIGYVVVLEDATELLHAQRQSAWKEVARRVAHEIKNPLTSIGLSAEQIRRHVQRLGETLDAHRVESASPGVIARCSGVILSSVETLRALVDQFSSLAQFPTARPQPSDLNSIVENSLALFAGRMQDIRIVRRLAEGLPLVMADPEAMKRALSNLIDNAAEAMQSSLLRELHIETCMAENGMVELAVADTGPGVTREMQERLFLPYFSTKQRGTGLGLAIAAKIVQEHEGTIRVEKNIPAGARFIVELRPVPGSETNPEAVVSHEGGEKS
ncbi:MAG: ATP-binding protein [Acidobacteriaceae bacterium]|nr:ATP-binding protein [Acidobacteriaceae bacterium]